MSSGFRLIFSLILGASRPFLRPDTKGTKSDPGRWRVWTNPARSLEKRSGSLAQLACRRPWRSLMPATTLLAGSWRLDVIGHSHWGASQRSLSLASPKTGPASDWGKTACCWICRRCNRQTSLGLSRLDLSHIEPTHTTPSGRLGCCELSPLPSLASLQISVLDGIDEGDTCYWLVWSSSLWALWFGTLCLGGASALEVGFVGPGFIDAAISGWGSPMLSLVRSARRR
jgi:hypothetical protein